MTTPPAPPAAPRAPAGEPAARTLFATYEALGIGRWSMDADDDGHVIAVHQSRELRDLIDQGESLSETLPLPVVLSLVHPDDLSAIRAALKAAIDDATGSTKYDVVYRVKNKTGAYHWFRAVGRRSERSIPGRHHFYGLLFRHDAEHAAQERLEAQRRDLLAIYEARHQRLEEIRALEAKERADLEAIRSVNNALAADRDRLADLKPVLEALGRDYSTVWLAHVPEMKLTLMRQTGVGLQVSEVTDIAKQADYAPGVALYADHCVHPDDREDFKAALEIHHVLRVLKENRSFRHVYRNLMNGRVTWYYADLALAAPGQSDDFVAGFRSADRDVIEEQQKKAELKAALNAAKAANLAKTQFLNAISHDIRTPLNAVTGMTALAAAHLKDPERVKAALVKMQSAGRELLELINSVLDLARLEAGKLVLAQDALHLPDLMKAVTDVLLEGARRKRQTFFLSVDGVVHEDAAGDARRLTAILAHLAENAVKFTPEGGRIDVRLEETGADAAGLHYRFTCRDSGIGIPADFIPRIFSPFERAADVHDAALPGSGLGLAIAKRLLPLMAGDIAVTSEEGRGTIFTADFVLRETPAEPPSPLAQGATILVADDDADEGRSICRHLAALGFAPDLALTEAEGLEKAERARAAGAPFSLYLIDWRLSTACEGESLVRALRKRDAAAPMLLMSAYDMTDAQAALSRERLAGFVKKPVFRSTLRAALLPVLSGHRAAEEPPAEPPAALSAGRVLVADDNAINREIALELLNELGVEAEGAVDGSDAVARFEAHPAGWYDLILMDLRMPVMDGLAATQAIRRSLRSDAETLPVIALSAERTPEDEEAAREAGMTGFITKPVTPGALAGLLAAHLAGS